MLRFSFYLMKQMNETIFVLFKLFQEKLTLNLYISTLYLKILQS